MPSAANLDPQLQAILREFQQGLQTLYPNQAVKLILFGSHARQTATPDSDIDLLSSCCQTFNPQGMKSSAWEISKRT